jgi:hypothetical protein
MSMQHTPIYRVSGLDFFKLLGVIAMGLVHPGLFLSRGTGIPQPTPGVMLGYDLYLLIGFFSICLPALAGSSLRTMIDKFYVGGRILNYDVREILVIAVFLCLLESVKNAILTTPLAFFSVDVLHFIALSMIVIVLLMQKWGVKAVYAFTVLSLIIGGAAPFVFALPGGEKLLMALVLCSRGIVRALVLAGPAWICYLLLLRFFPQIRTFSKGRKILPVGAAILCGLIISYGLWIFVVAKVIFSFVAETAPLGALFRTSATFSHMWPLFPWFALVGVGFLISDLVAGAKNKSKILWLALLVGTLGFVAFFIWGIQDYAALMQDKHYFSGKVFAAPLSVVAGIISFYVMVFAFLSLVFSKISLQSKIIHNCSRGIVIFYVVHFLVSFFLYQPATNVIGRDYVMIVFPYIVMAISYAILVLVMGLFGRPLLVQLRRRA